MANNGKYHSKSQAALIKVMEAFAADNFPELSLAELTQRTGLPKNVIFRTTHNLYQVGWLDKLPGERHRLSQDWAQIGYRYLEHLVKKRNQLHQQIQEFRQA